MIRTGTVTLLSIPAIAYRQKLASGDIGITLLRYHVAQPGLATISRKTGEAVPAKNTSLELYPPDSFNEAIKLTSGMPYKRLGNVIVSEEIIVEEPLTEATEESTEEEEIEVIINSEEYQRILDRYTDKNGKLSYDLINSEFIKTAHSSGQVRLMIENRASVDEIRFQVVKAQLKSITRNPALTDAEIHKMIELLDEVSPKGVFKPFNEEIRKWIAKNKKTQKDLIYPGDLT